MSITRSTNAAAGALLLFTVAGCGGDTHESVAKELVAKMKEMTATLKDVKDSASAKAAAPKLKTIGEEMKAINFKMEKLPKAGADQEKTLKDTYEKEFGTAMTDFMTEAMRVSMLGPDVQKEIEGAMGSTKGGFLAPSQP